MDIMSLSDVLKVREIFEKIKKAAKKSYKSGLESDFVVVRKNGKRIIGEVVENEVSFWGERNVIEEMYDGDLLYIEATIHFHVDQKILIPSPNDLFLFCGSSKLRRWSVIGSVEEKKNNLLFMTSYGITMEDVNLWHCEEDFFDENDVSQRLAEIGIETEFGTL